MSDPVTTAGLRRLLSERHAMTSPGSIEWVLFFELRNGTGFGREVRSVDAFAMHTWPSKGFHRHAYELKASRSDWLSELQQPEKRAWGMEISHQFWFVTSPGVVTDLGEVPEGCGLLVATASGDKLIARRQAQQREPRELRAAEVAAIARQACDRAVFQRPAWRYAGRELDEAGLHDVVMAHLDRAQEAEIERRARERALERVEQWRKALDMYAGALRAAGIAPPRWMTGADFDVHVGTWDARRWAERVVQPPSVAAVADALRAVKNGATALTQAREQLETLAAEMAPARTTEDAPT